MGNMERERLASSSWIQRSSERPTVLPAPLCRPHIRLLYQEDSCSQAYTTRDHRSRTCERLDNGAQYDRKMRKKTIPWKVVASAIQDKFGYQIGPTKLAHEIQKLGGQAQKNTVSNWAGRGGMPVEWVPHIAKITGFPPAHFFSAGGLSDLDQEGNKSDLSPEARALILQIIRLDKNDDLSRKTFTAYAGLLQLSLLSNQSQDLPSEQESLERAIQTLGTELGNLEGSKNEERSG